MKLSDADTRHYALDTNNSFIVQAPAGSGKTELLTQRFLSLLAQVNTPEEIIAITFTRKAAKEMHERILQALHRANSAVMPEAAHLQSNWQLARRVLHRDEQLQWQLLRSPSRLRVTTIDSLCHSLTAAMPLLSKGVPYAAITEDAQPYYQMAAKNCLQDALNTNQTAITTLLLHLGNHQLRCVNLMAAMLAKREQWLPYLMAARGDEVVFRNMLEQGLEQIRLDAIAELIELFDQHLLQELISIAQFAASNLLQMQESEHPIATFSNEVSQDNHIFWIAIAELLLTQDHQWRRQLSKKQGFIAKANCKNKQEQELNEQMKQHLLDILQTLSQQEALRISLQHLRMCPPCQYHEKQWEVIKAFVDILPLLAAHLKLVFSEHATVDFTEISQLASHALGELLNPSDLSLYLDYKIKHLLVDEFQDTSVSQFNLLEKLTAGWQTQDGRTLFIVGDPMQSIYRFREADVSLFLRAKEQGVGNIHLVPLQLSSNFRSTANIVNWVNTSFPDIFPSRDELSLSAISYHASAAMLDHREDSGVYFHACNDELQQVAEIIDLINTKQQQDPQHTIAILVRSRNQLSTLLTFLRIANIKFQGVDIDNLATRPIIQDLWSLTTALLHPSDRLAWFCILRAPWCGLKLSELLVIAENCHHRPVISALAIAASFSHISTDGLRRIQHLHQVMSHALEQRQRFTLSQWIVNTWRNLGGPSSISQESLADANQFWQLLDEHEENGLVKDLSVMREKITRLFSNTDSSSNLQIMTIHKSKGLEFDTVILPGLESSSSSHDTPFLQWLERCNALGENQLILAPLKASDSTEDKIYQYLSYLNQYKDQFELQRLLYVAVTRAKSHLHFFANFSIDDTLRKNSLLQLLQPHLPAPQPLLAASLSLDLTPNNQLSRLPDEFYLQHSFEPDTIPAAYGSNPTLSDDDDMRLIGIFIHEQLKFCCDYQINHTKQINSVNWSTRFTNLGISAKHHALADELTRQALQNFFECPRAQWIRASHLEAKNEWSLTHHHQDKIHRYVIDRTFIDKQTQQRWIIDYKISLLNINSIPDAYQKQLETYAALLQQMKPQSVYLGLYYPLSRTWFEWVID